MAVAGFSKEAETARRGWIARVMSVIMAAAVFSEGVKTFKPKFPDIPVLNSYRGTAPDYFWDKFPSYLICPGKPSLNRKKIKQWAYALGCSKPKRLARVIEYSGRRIYGARQNYEARHFRC